MDRQQAIAELPFPYATALRLRDADAGDEVIAVALGIEREAVANVLELASAKLRSLLDRCDPPGGDGASPA